MGKIVYLDMDGVLADFDGTTQMLLGSAYNLKEEVNKPNWGMLHSLQNVFSLLRPLPDAFELWEYVNSSYDDVRILTAIPKRAHFPEAANDKRNWIHELFGSHVKVCFGPYAFDKQFHCRPGDILIDDSAINIAQWKDRDGLGILHTSARNTIQELAKQSARKRGGEHAEIHNWAE